MYCKNCGNPIPEGAQVCMQCGFGLGTGSNFCANCGQQITPGAAVCTNCGAMTGQSYLGTSDKSKLAYGLLGIFLGGLGIHNFYLGNKKRGLIQLLVSLLTCGFGAVPMQIWGLVEGIQGLCGNVTDMEGRPLKD